MTQSNYSRKENGSAKISLTEWNLLSKKLQVALEDIYEPDESQIFIFNDNATGNGNIVHNYNIPMSLWESQQKYTKNLEEENEILKEQLKKLRENISK